MISTELERRSYKVSNPIAEFSGIVGGGSPLPSAHTERKRASAIELAFTCYWYREEKHVADFFVERKPAIS
jgi:hypothetical protein